MIRRNHPLYLGLALFATTAIGCGDDDSEDTGAESTTTSGDTETTTGEPGDTETTSSTTDVEASSSGETGETGEPGETASIRVVHASPTAPAVDVYVAGQDTPVIEGLAYGQASEYLEVPAGTYDFEVRPAGSDASAMAVYSTGDLELPAGAVITAAAVGLLDQLEDDGPSAFRVLPLVEGFEDAGDATRIRIVHAGSDAPEVGIDVGNDESSELTVAPFADTGPEGVELPAGTSLQVGIRDANEASVTAFTIPELPAGTQGFVIATGLLGNLAREDAGFSLLAIVPALPDPIFIRQNPRVYALHAGIDVGPVDICLGDAPLFEGSVSYGQLAAEGASVQVPPGSYDLSFRAADKTTCAGDEAATASTGDLEAGQRYLAIAAGELSTEGEEDDDAGFSLIRATEEFTLGMDDMGVASVIHAASAPLVNVSELDGETVVTPPAVLGLTFGTVSRSELVEEPGDFTFGLTTGEVVNEQTLVPGTATSLPVTAGFRGWAIAVGDLDPNPDDAVTEEPLAIWAVDTTATPWALIPLEAPTE